LKLDPARVAVVQQETAKVARLLHDVFAEEDEPKKAVQAENCSTRVQSLPSTFALDASHRQLLESMLAQGVWARCELEALVAQHDLMLDGAIETLNEAVLDAFGIGLIEGDDPFEINSEVERLILQAAAKAS
jgi:PAS domain-containing protein